MKKIILSATLILTFLISCNNNQSQNNNSQGWIQEFLKFIQI